MEAVLDYGLPGIAAVGAGLLAYAFTGGEEEYPSQQSQPENVAETNNIDSRYEEVVEDEGNNLEERLELVFNGFEEHLKGLTTLNETILTKVETIGKVQPVWATELLEKVRQLTIDVAEMKQNQRQLLLHSQPNTAENNVDNDQRCFDRVDLAIACLENGVPFDMPVDVFLSTEQLNAAYFIKNHSKIGLACDMLSMFIKNVIKHPDSQRFRKINTSNANYKTMLGNLPGYQRVLIAVGFVLRSVFWEWVWGSDNHTIDTTTPGVRSGDDKPKPEITGKIMQYMLDKLQVLRSEEYRASVAASLAATTTAAEEVVESVEKAPTPEPEPAAIIAPTHDSSSQPVAATTAAAAEVSKTNSTATIVEAVQTPSSLPKKSAASNEDLVDIMEDIDDLTASSLDKPLGTPYNQRRYSFSSRGGLLGTANLPIGLRFDDIAKKVDSATKK